MSMARIYGNDKSWGRDFGDSSQLNNWVLYSGAMCNMIPQFSDSIQVSLEDMDKYIEVTYWYYVTSNQKVQVQIKMCNNNINPFIAKLHNVILAPDLFDRLFSIIILMNLGHTFLFHKWFFTV